VAQVAEIWPTCTDLRMTAANDCAEYCKACVLSPNSTVQKGGRGLPAHNPRSTDRGYLARKEPT
jgi:hypothetical protein